MTKNFDELSAVQVYEMYRLRSKVFVVEQHCAYLDPDEKDPRAKHVFLFDGETLAAYARILEPGISYKEPSIGRVVVDEKYRRSGTGRELMKVCINKTRELFKNQDIVISAQSYLIRFYTDLGFKAIINNRFLGLLYKNEIFEPLRVGDRKKGFIKVIREDDKVDLSL
ncbi:MAG: GNAT family N-acetyltransferase, partial [Bacteroidota bacterium]